MMFSALEYFVGDGIQQKGGNIKARLRYVSFNIIKSISIRSYL